MLDVNLREAFEARKEEDVRGTIDGVRERLHTKVLSSLVSSYSESLHTQQEGLSFAMLPLPVASSTRIDMLAQTASKGS